MVRRNTASQKIVQALEETSDGKMNWQNLLRITGLSKGSLSKNLRSLQVHNLIVRECDSETGTPYYKVNPLREGIRISFDLSNLPPKLVKKRRIKDEAVLAVLPELMKRVNNHPYLLDTIILDFFDFHLRDWYQHLEFFLETKPQRSYSKHRPLKCSPLLRPGKLFHLRGFKSIEEIWDAAMSYMTTMTYNHLISEGFAVTEEEVGNIIINLRNSGFGIERKTFYQIQPYERLNETSIRNRDYLFSMLRRLLKKVEREKAAISPSRTAKIRTSEWLYESVKHLRQPREQAKRS